MYTILTTQPGNIVLVITMTMLAIASLHMARRQWYMLVCSWCESPTTIINTGEDWLDYCECCHVLEDTKEIHMRVFISAERANLDSLTNKSNTVYLQWLLDQAGLAYDVVLGSYEGSEETAFQVHVEPDSVSELVAIAKEFSQESIMTVDHLNRTNFIKVSNGFVTEGGLLRKIPSNDLPDAWVKINDEYFSAS